MLELMTPGQKQVGDRTSQRESIRATEGPNSRPKDSCAQLKVTEPALRDWQKDLLEVFQKAVLPASQRLFDFVRNSGESQEPSGESLEESLKEYYATIKRDKLNEREMVWGKAEKKIETFLLSPPSRVNGGKRFLRAQYQAATGAGKTRSFVEMIRAHLDSGVRVDKGNEPLYVVVEPSLVLVEQTYAALQRHVGIDCVCVCSSGNVPSVDRKSIISHVHKQRARRRPTVIVTTIHSAAGQSNRPGLLDEFTGKGVIADLLILDESHKYAGDAAGKIQKETFVKNAEAAMLKISCTATPTVRSVPEDHSNGFETNEKAKAGGLFFCQNDANGVFGPVMCRYTYGEGLEDGVVAPLQLHLMDNSIPDAAPFREYVRALVKEWDIDRSNECDEWPEKVGSVIVDPLDATSAEQRAGEESSWRCERFLMACRIVHEFAVGNQTHMLAFCSSRQQRVIHLTKLVEFVCTKMIAAIDGGTRPLGYDFGPKERGRLATLRQNCFYEVSDSKGKVELFRNSELGLLANANMLNEGVDIPHITGIWYPDTKPITDTHRLIQSVGRGTRTADRKTGCVVFMPCFLSDAPVAFSLGDAMKTKEMLQKLDRKSNAGRKNWEVVFSDMAKGILGFFIENENDMHDFSVQLSGWQGDQVATRGQHPSHLVGAIRDPSTPATSIKVPPESLSDLTSLTAPGTESPIQRKARISRGSGSTSATEGYDSDTGVASTAESRPTENWDSKLDLP